MRMVIINLSSGNNAKASYPALFQEGTTLLTLLPVYISYMSSGDVSKLTTAIILFLLSGASLRRRRFFLSFF